MAFPPEPLGCPRLPLKSSRKGCIMHGWTSHPDGLNHPAHKMSFKMFGRIMSNIVQSIMLHTTKYTASQSSAVVTLMTLGASFDVMGYDAFGPGTFNYIHRKTVQEIEKQFPCGIKEFDLKPNCIMGHFRLGGGRELMKKAHVESLVPVDEVINVE
ncbi:hypothetical protein DFH08DRAFT_818253 [Mycena albidolilacea]|uniref:Uncharacterized protein n=1 Tax=Mycena albidolilacea TaxID=1033008 RepID=A0AAD7EGR1_9AGAR|nr:hypothetical protein DFH08DRAFT_818253 [Mycena albidolilacea]